MGDDLPIRTLIALELHAAIRKLGGKSDLLAILGWYGDPLRDDEVLRGLRRWNAEHLTGAPLDEEGLPGCMASALEHRKETQQSARHAGQSRTGGPPEPEASILPNAMLGSSNSKFGQLSKVPGQLC